MKRMLRQRQFLRYIGMETHHMHNLDRFNGFQLRCPARLWRRITGRRRYAHLPAMLCDILGCYFSQNILSMSNLVVYWIDLVSAMESVHVFLWLNPAYFGLSGTGICGVQKMPELRNSSEQVAWLKDIRYMHGESNLCILKWPRTFRSNI